MKRTLLPLVLLLVPMSALAQNSPGADALHAMVGHWTYDHMEGYSDCEMLGESYVVCEGGWTNDDGSETVAIFHTGYNAQNDQYHTWRFYGGGYADSGRAWIDGNTWVTLYVSDAGVVRKASSTIDGNNWSYQWEAFDDTGEWGVTSTGSMTRR